MKSAYEIFQNKTMEKLQILKHGSGLAWPITPPPSRTREKVRKVRNPEPSKPRTRL